MAGKPKNQTRHQSREYYQSQGGGEDGADVCIPTDHKANYFFSRLMSAGLSQFDYGNVPSSMNMRYAELKMLTEGRMAVYKPTGTNFLLSTGFKHQTGRFNTYDEPRGITGLAGTGGREIPTDDYTIVYDNMNHDILLPYMWSCALEMAEAHQTAMANMMRMNTPYLLTASPDESASVKNVFRAIRRFAPVITVGKGLNLEERLIKTDMEVPFKANDITEYQRKLWKEALSMLGISSETTKKERLIGSEIALNRQEDTVALNSRLKTRIEMCNTLNEKYNLNITVNMVDYETPDPGAMPDQEEEY